jgi:hypothetical protein
VKPPLDPDYTRLRHIRPWQWALMLALGALLVVKFIAACLEVV